MTWAAVDFEQLGPEDAGPEEGGFEQVQRLDTELFRLARGAGLVRLRIGQALARMGEGYGELGFSSLGAYALERCSRRGRWASESRALAKRLEELPCLRAALENGDVGWSMAALVAKSATPDNETALLEQALKKTVRAMREWLRAQCAASRDVNADADAGTGACSDDEDEDAQPRRRTLTLSVPIEEAYMLDAVRRLVGHIDGRSSSSDGGDWFEALLAEGQDALMNHVPPSAELLPQDVVARHEAWLARVHEAEELRRQAETRAEAHLPRQVWRFDALDGKPDDEDLPFDLRTLDTRIRQWSQELAARDLWFGKHIERFLACHGWRMLGYASETQYARERLGMARSAMRGKLALARNTRWLQQTAHALQRGAIGYEAAALVARVASVDTEAAWLERAQRRTFKHLREDVEAAEWVTRLSPEVCAGELLPPTAEQLSWVQAAERDILSGDVLKRAALDATEAANANTCHKGYAGSAELDDMVADDMVADDMVADDMVADDMASSDAAVQMFVGRNVVNCDGDRSAYTTVRVRVDEEAALWFRQLEETFRRRAPGRSFIRFMCMAFFRAWTHTLGKSNKWEAIYRRDLYRCTNPTCDRRSVTPHHVEYRSHGGDDRPDNVTSPCEWCHLEGEHGGRLKIRGRAPELTWILGREPIMQVVGRERAAM